MTEWNLGASSFVPSFVPKNIPTVTPAPAPAAAAAPAPAPTRASAPTTLFSSYSGYVFKSEKFPTPAPAATAQTPAPAPAVTSIADVPVFKPMSEIKTPATGTTASAPETTEPTPAKPAPEVKPVAETTAATPAAPAATTTTAPVTAAATTTTSAAAPSEPEPKQEEESGPIPKGYWGSTDAGSKQYSIEDMILVRSTPKDPVFMNNKELSKMRRIGQNRLSTSDNGWKKLSAEARQKTTTQLQLILNRLVSTNCDEMTQEILKLDLGSKEILENLVEQIYEKAVKEVKYVKTYGKMCGKLEEAALHTRIKDLPEDSKFTFRKLLTDHCSKAFEEDMKKWKEARTKSREGLSQEKLEELDLEESKAKARYLGNTQFIAQLFLVKIVSVNVLTYCIISLLKSNDPPDEECIETLCKLMESVGKQLQEKLNKREDNAKFFMNTVFKRFQRYSEMTDKYPNRIRFLILNTIEMRESWSGTQRPTSPQPLRATSPLPARSTSPIPLHAPTPLHVTRPMTPSAAQTPLLPVRSTTSEMVSPPVISPDPFRVTPESQKKAMNTITTELMQFVDSNDREEFMASMKEGVNKDLYYLVVPGVLRFLLKDNAKDAKTLIEKLKTLLIDFVDEEGVNIREGLDYFKNEFLEYGEDSPVSAAEITGVIFSALCKNDPEGDVFHALLNCLAGLATEDLFWNPPNRTARAAGFAATAMAEMFSDIIKEQGNAGRDPYVDLCGMLDREAVDVRALMPDSVDAMRTFTSLAALLKEKSLAPLFPSICDASLVVEALSSMQPLTPEKLSDWIDKAEEAKKGSRAYFAVLVADEVLSTMKNTAKDGNVDISPWIPVLKKLEGPSSLVHFEVGLLNAMCRCWSGTEKKTGALKSMAMKAKESGLITKFAFDKWRVDSSDRNSTLKDEAFNNELTDLFMV